MRKQTRPVETIFRQGQKTGLIARRVANKSQSTSWRKTWSRSFRKNILGLDDNDDPEAARLKKYRTRRKRYGGKHFIIALYHCGKPENDPARKVSGALRANSMTNLSGSQSNLSKFTASNGQLGVEENAEELDKEPDTFCQEIMGRIYEF